MTLKGDMIVTPTTLFSQRAEPAPLWLGISEKATLDAGQHGFSASAAERRSEAAPRVSLREGHQYFRLGWRVLTRTHFSQPNGDHRELGICWRKVVNPRYPHT